MVYRTSMCLMLLILAKFTFGQEIQWAANVVRVSSEFDYAKYPTQYRAEQVLGEPSLEIKGGQSAAAWSPAKENNPIAYGEFVEVSFAKPMSIQQVLIHENFNAGAVSRITLIDTERNNHVVYNDTSMKAWPSGRLLQVTFSKTSYSVATVLVELSTFKSNGYNQIDAIGIADNTHLPTSFIRLTSTNSSRIEKESLGPKINSSVDELCPVITPDGKTIYFTRDGHPDNIGGVYQDIWMSNIDSTGQFDYPINLGKPLNNDQNSTLSSITPDGNKALLLNIYKPDGSMGKGLSMTTRGPNGWGFPETVKMDDYYNDNTFAEFSLSNSGDVIILTIQRKDGVGSKDLHYSLLKEDGTWTAPVNMGKVINTVGSETSPFLAADNRTLYFASECFPGYGSKDIFMTRRIGNGWENWTPPINMGNSINTDGFDAYYTLPASGDYAYFTSKSPSNKVDIYRIPVPKELRPNPVTLIKGTIRDKKSGAFLATSVQYYSLTTEQLMGTAISNEKDGSYQIVLPAGDHYGFSAQKEGFIGISSDIRLDTVSVYQEIIRDLYLAPIEVGTRIVVNNIYFDFDKANLRKESYVELKQLAALMKKNPTMKVEIEGHTDDVGNDAYNLTLSGNRAKSVSAYLISCGIAAERIMSTGKGENNPVAPNDTDENKQLNRRVEFIIRSL